MAWPKGKPKSEEQKAKQRAAMVGKVLMEEHKTKIGKATKRRWEQNDPHLISARESATKARTQGLGSLCKHGDGYWLIKTRLGWELQHRVLMAELLGRPLTPEEVVHHRDGNKENNDLSNLELMAAGEHSRHHMTGKPKTRIGA